jgi:hypothetical protein
MLNKKEESIRRKQRFTDAYHSVQTPEKGVQTL